LHEWQTAWIQPRRRVTRRLGWVQVVCMFLPWSRLIGRDFKQRRFSYIPSWENIPRANNH